MPASPPRPIFRGEGANEQRRACVGCEDVQEIVVSTSEERPASLVMKPGDQVEQHLPDSTQTRFGAGNQQKQQQETREQIAHVAQDRESDRTLDHMHYRNSRLRQTTGEAIVLRGLV